MKKLGILVGKRGRGSNMAAIVRACQTGALDAQVEWVASTGEQAPALEVARGLGISASVLSSADDLVDLPPVDLICLAGFLSLVPASVIEAYRGRILNIHPALLPKFGGPGMYGMRVHEAVLAAGETKTGCTVHWVTERYDEGPILLQRTCPVESADTPATLAARVLVEEHLAYVEALRIALAD